MSQMDIGSPLDAARRPLVLLVPGLNGAEPGHWLRIWAETRGDCELVDLGLWSAPRRNPWITRLDQAIRSAEAPVVLVAHGLGCLAVAWWAALAGQPYGWPVSGAMLVAPRADVDGFSPSPTAAMPFPSLLVTSQDDPSTSPQRATDMAKFWGSALVDAGELGRIDAHSGLGAWDDGQRLLDRLLDGEAIDARTQAAFATEPRRFPDRPVSRSASGLPN